MTLPEPAPPEPAASPAAPSAPPWQTADGPLAVASAPPRVPAQRGPSGPLTPYPGAPAIPIGQQPVVASIAVDWAPAALPYPAAPAAAPRRGRLLPALVVLLALSAVLALLGSAAAAASLANLLPGTARAQWVEATGPTVRNLAVRALLERRGTAVRARDRAAFLADIHGHDGAFQRRQEVTYDNLVKLGLSELTYTLEPRGDNGTIPAAMRTRYNDEAVALAVTMQYKVEGVDSKAVAVPWVPIVAPVDGRWLIVGEASGKDLPFGLNGQAWDAGPITVVRGRRVVAVLSADDADRGSFLLQLAEAALDRVAAVRNGGWDGKVLVTAVQEQRIFDTYFADSPERVAEVAAIAVPYYDRVLDWHSGGHYATTRIVFNPQELTAQPQELGHDLTHEFTHAAMGPVTTGYTPRWLVEGFAEYVAYKSQPVSASGLKRVLGEVRTEAGLPPDDTFYDDPHNYLAGWMACKMIAEKYGEAKLVTLYEAYQNPVTASKALGDVLGTSPEQLNADWRAYVQKQR
jgi:hypothetical protein